MTRVKSLLEDYVKKDSPMVTYGDNGERKTKGFWNHQVQVGSILKCVLCQRIKAYLISISQLCDVDYEVLFNKHEGKVIDSNSVTVLSTNLRSDIYILDMFSTNNSFRRCFLSRYKAHMYWLWKKRHSHLNFKALSKISSDQLVRGLPEIKLFKENVCVACEKGKQTKSFFKPKLCSSISDPFHLLHMDLLGPSLVESFFLQEVLISYC